MDSRKVYEAPEAEVILFDSEDIVRTSTPETRTPIQIVTGFNVF